MKIDGGNNGKVKKEKLMTFEEIGKKLGISKVAAYKIYERAMQKIKDNYDIKYMNGKPVFEKKAKPVVRRRKKYIRKYKGKNGKWIYIY